MRAKWHFWIYVGQTDTTDTNSYDVLLTNVTFNFILLILAGAFFELLTWVSYDILPETLPSPLSESEILSVLGKMFTNCGDLELPATQGRGNGFYPTYANMNHSCRANTKTFKYPDQRLEVRAQVNCKTFNRKTSIKQEFSLRFGSLKEVKFPPNMSNPWRQPMLEDLSWGLNGILTVPVIAVLTPLNVVLISLLSSAPLPLPPSPA